MKQSHHFQGVSSQSIQFAEHAKSQVIIGLLTPNADHLCESYTWHTLQHRGPGGVATRSDKSGERWHWKESLRELTAGSVKILDFTYPPAGLTNLKGSAIVVCAISSYDPLTSDLDGLSAEAACLWHTLLAKVFSSLVWDLRLTVEWGGETQKCNVKGDARGIEKQMLLFCLRLELLSWAPSILDTSAACQFKDYDLVWIKVSLKDTQVLILHMVTWHRTDLNFQLIGDWNPGSFNRL